MKPEAGSRDSPIWLIGDSPPEAWKDKLSVPLDPRHPTRHSIWTPIIDGIQERVYEYGRLRLNTSRMYVRNAVEDAKDKAKGKDWSNLEKEAGELGALLDEYNPLLVFTFGAFAFEFVNRSRCGKENRAVTYWSAKRLGKQFQHNLNEFALGDVNVLPLLHVSIARGKFLECHRDFSGNGGNYFNYVATKIASLLLKHKDSLNIWVS